MWNVIISPRKHSLCSSLEAIVAAHLRYEIEYSKRMKVGNFSNLSPAQSSLSGLEMMLPAHRVREIRDLVEERLAL